MKNILKNWKKKKFLFFKKNNKKSESKFKKLKNNLIFKYNQINLSFFSNWYIKHRNTAKTDGSFKIKHFINKKPLYLRFEENYQKYRKSKILL